MGVLWKRGRACDMGTCMCVSVIRWMRELSREGLVQNAEMKEEG